MASTPASSQPAPSGGSGAGSLDMITTGVQAAAMIAQTISNISDQNKRRAIESNLALLSEKEKIDLANRMARQQTKNDQATILINAVMATRNAQADREQRAQTIKWILIGGVGIASIAMIAWVYKS